MNKVMELYFASCQELNLNPFVIEEINGFKVSFGKKTFFFSSGNTPFNDAASASITYDKFFTNKLLEKSGLPVPRAIACTRDYFEQAKLDVSHLNFPLVTKPTYDSSCGEDVFCNIKDEAQLHSILKKSYEYYFCMSIEEYQADLRSYRVLVLYGKVIGLVERIPAHVIGDGIHTISELIKIQNNERERLRHVLPLGDLIIMDETLEIFKELGVTAETIPKKNDKIPLRYICNSTYGGSIIGLHLNKIHPKNAKLAESAAKALNLNFVGFDLICEDISIPIENSRGYFIEANQNPDITIHENVKNGTTTRVSRTVMKKLIQQNLLAYFLHKIFTKYITLCIKIIAILVVALWSYKVYVLK
jgi:cyanophycin synthetase